MAENLVIKQNQEKQNLIRAAFKSACIAEIKALKPGNVHIFSNSHGMTVEDFMVSAKISAEEISEFSTFSILLIKVVSTLILNSSNNILISSTWNILR